MKIFRWISAAVSEAIYPLIPQLYNIFNILAKYTFFEDGQVEKLSNNLYILISVCMLFAFGIRLLNGIVNPEIVGDKKKGTRTVFLNAFFSVILMALIPFGFDALREVQSHVIDSALIEKFMLGTTLSDKQDPGQILAAYTFSSTCYPEKTVGDDKIEELYAGTLEDIDDIKYLSKKVTKTHKDSNGEDEYDLHYETILSPLAGGVVVYEMILICMDVALRTVKLGLLELITPIILCGFIFKGSELLQKWTKEVISTYILLFLKVAMIVFMIYGMALLPGFMDRIDFPKGTGDFTKGLIKLFILIGLLQVVKQLPNIINALFGTNIQPRGGIKGRLGEMAAVGKMAQDGWSALGNKLKPVGIAAAKVGALAASGPLGWAAAGGAAAAGYGVKKWWNKGIGDHGPAKDTELGKKARTVGAVAKGVGKGLGKKGGLFASIEEGKKAYNDTDISKINKAAITNANRSMGFRMFKVDDNGRLKPINQINDNLTNGAYGADKAKASQIAAGQRKRAVQQEYDNIDNKIENTYKNAKRMGVSRDIIDKQKEYKEAALKKSHADLADKKYKAVNETVDNMINKAASSGQQDLAQKLTDIKSDFVKGKFDMSQYINKIAAEQGVAAGDVSKLRADSDSFQKAIDAKITFKNSAGQTITASISDMIPKTDGGGFVITDLGDTVTALTKDHDSKKTAIERKMTELNYKDDQKEIVNSVTDSISVTTEALAAANSKFIVSSNPGDSNYENFQLQQQGYSTTIPINGNVITPIVQSNQNSSTSGQGGQNTQQNNNPPTGSGDSGGNGGVQGQPIQHQQGDSSNPDHQNNGSYTPGIYTPNGAPSQITGDVNATVDLSSLEQGLAAINNSVNASGQHVANAVNNQGSKISSELTTANERLKHMDAGITLSNTKLDNIGKGIGDMKSSIDNMSIKLDEPSSDDHNDQNTT